MRRVRAAGSLFASMLLLVATDLCAATPKVLFVLSKAGAPYTDVVDAARAELPAQRVAELHIEVQTVERLRANVLPAAQLVVTVGVAAAQHVAQADPPAPVLHTLLPRASADEILQHGRDKGAARRDSAVFLDQPIGRRLDLLRLALPRHRRVAAIIGPSTESFAAELHAAARKRGLQLNSTSLMGQEELLPLLHDILEHSDVLLSVPDPMVYNSQSIHHLLLTTYRYKVPVFGLSQAYVDAGALLAVYSTPAQIGRQIGQWLANLPRHGSITLPAPAYPQFFQVSVNRRVAASLELTLDSEEVLQEKLEALTRP